MRRSKPADSRNMQNGLRAEHHFSAMLNRVGIKHDYIDRWYDYQVCGKKVEVKSCQLTTRQGRGFRSGRFNFDSEETRKKIFDEDIWICFILMHEEDFIVLGFCKGKSLKKKRWINPHSIKKYHPLSFKEWINEILYVKN